MRMIGNSLSDRRQPFNRVRIPLDEIDEQCGLRVWLSSPLLPVFESPNVGPQVDREERPRKLQALAHANQLFRCDSRRGLVLQRVCSERSLARAHFGERVHALAQLREQVPLLGLRGLRTTFHDLLLISNSAFIIIFSLWRWGGVRSDISSLSYSV